MVKGLVLTLALSFLVSFVGYGPAAAIETTPTVPKKPTSPLLLTEFRVDSANLSYIQLYNNGSDAVYVADWELVNRYKQGGSYAYALPEGYMAPGTYVVVAAPDVVTGEFVEELVGGEDIEATDSFWLESRAGAFEPEPVPIATAKDGSRYHRYVSTAGNYTGTQTFREIWSVSGAAANPNAVLPPLNADPLLEIRESFPLAPIEILANPRQCAPTEQDAACGDYVKFYNDTGEPVDFAGVRLRMGFLGQSATASNAIPLGGVLQPGEFALFNTNANGAPLNLTNSGGFVWLEYVYGVQLYENTVVEYADAASHKGRSWAVDGDGNWRWAMPQPAGANNFALPLAELAACAEGQYRHPETNRCRKIETSNEPKPCAADQERNPETGRCRKIQIAAALTPRRPDQYRHPETNRCRKLETNAGPTPCRADQYRNPDTGRCRKIETPNTPKPCNPDQFRNPETGRCKKLASATAPKPCRADQFRNPETGRCKKIATPTELKPCAPGQERNPDTNRCRKIQKDLSDPGFSVESVETAADTVASWWALGGVGSLAVGYAGWEWRSEMARWLRRVREFFAAKGS